MRWFAIKVAAIAAWAAVVAGRDIPISDVHYQSHVAAARSPNYSQLKSKLSSKAQVLLPGSAAFTNATARWSALEEPTANAVVVPATENDVVETVRALYQILEMTVLTLEL